MRYCSINIDKTFDVVLFQWEFQYIQGDDENLLEGKIASKFQGQQMVGRQMRENWVLDFKEVQEAFISRTKYMQYFNSDPMKYCFWYYLYLSMLVITSQ